MNDFSATIRESKQASQVIAYRPTLVYRVDSLCGVYGVLTTDKMAIYIIPIAKNTKSKWKMQITEFSLRNFYANKASFI